MMSKMLENRDQIGQADLSYQDKTKKRSPDWAACIPAHPPGEGQWDKPVSDAGNAHARAWAAGRTGPPTASIPFRPGNAGPAVIVLRDGKMWGRDGRGVARITASSGRGVGENGLAGDKLLRGRKMSIRRYLGRK